MSLNVLGHICTYVQAILTHIN